ncbi:peptide methionine sulfoxide reductase [Hoeflea sp. BAL378]|uniref:peptide-methionine (S)-S-oxide reductase MsrA n=1 Tax=Hoeflea sp. BAL378 TaxID=1547437 RepID=UPI0005145E17|nr:peptide-methionine (S)-S-oxide reductase MsrA [Hoeflea sp. BAL378]KGF67180.1 peptide methionine sulfoxide reductase [Hoeflea sp. BAL378]
MLRLLLSSALMTIVLAVPPAGAQESGTAVFAGGCFWCVEKDFDHVKGVTATVSGYIGGKADNPTYESHTANGDREAVQITYDPAVVSYAELLATFFRTVDPTDGGGQFCDRGHSYTTAVYALNDKQKAEAEAAKAEAGKALGKPVVTEIEPAATFWPAEDYHQDFYRKSPVRYTYYRRACGRDAAVTSLWGGEAFKGVDK